MSKVVRRGVTVAVLLVLLATICLFYVVDPEVNLFFPKCPFLLITGYQCPGCGSQRAIHHLLHLNFAAAFRYNAFMLFLLPYIFIAIYMDCLGGKVKHPRLSRILFGRWSAPTILIILLAYWILRNLF